MNSCIVWFRRDLRLYDNPALDWACKHFEAIIPVYIHAPDEEQPWAPGGASRWWLEHSLRHLDQALSNSGHRLYRFDGPSADTLLRISKLTGNHGA